MLVLIFVIAVVFTVIFGRTKKKKLFEVFLCISVLMAMCVSGFFGAYMGKLSTKSDLNQYENNCKIIEEKMQRLEEQMNAEDLWDKARLKQFLEELEDLEDELETNNNMIEAWHGFWENGGKEDVEFLLFFKSKA